MCMAVRVFSLFLFLSTTIHGYHRSITVESELLKRIACVERQNRIESIEIQFTPKISSGPKGNNLD